MEALHRLFHQFPAPQFLQQAEGPMVLQRMVEHLQADGFQRRPVRSGIDGEGVPSGERALGVGGKEGVYLLPGIPGIPEIISPVQKTGNPI